MSVGVLQPPQPLTPPAIPTVAEAIESVARRTVGRAVIPPITREALVDEVDREVGRTHRTIGEILASLRKSRARDPKRQEQIRELERSIAAMIEWRRRNGDGLPKDGGQ